MIFCLPPFLYIYIYFVFISFPVHMCTDKPSVLVDTHACLIGIYICDYLRPTIVILWSGRLYKFTIEENSNILSKSRAAEFITQN